MKIKEGFILREVAGSHIVVAVGQAVKTFNGIINLNPTSALLWKNLEKALKKKNLLRHCLPNMTLAKKLLKVT